MNISYFAPSTQRGKNLYKAISEKIDQSITVYYSEESTQTDFLLAVHTSDVVIVDCTIPDHLDKSSITVYPLLTAQVNIFDHIIVVSESQLPLNITPSRGIYPHADNEVTTAEQIVCGIRTIVEQVIENDTYPRLSHKKIEQLLEDQMGMERMLTDSLDIKGKRTHNKPLVMISYRNSHSKDVELFKQEILKEQNVEIKMLPPASLCGEREAHTPMRRWMLVGLLDDHIREVDEVWIYETEDYLNSWWTIAELVMTANINHHNSKQIKVKVYNPETKSFYDEVPSRYNVTITDKQHQRLARFLSNTRPDTMGPESLVQIKQLKQVAAFLRIAPEETKQQMLNNLKSYLEMSVPKSLDGDGRQEMIEGMMKMYSDPDELERYSNDDVFQDEFWNYISSQTKQNTDAYNEKDGTINIDAFINVPMNEVTQYKPEDFANAAKSDEALELGQEGDRHSYSISRSNVGCRYLWLATRMGQPTIKQAPGLERIDIYDVQLFDVKKAE